jgi:hypothetical protein
MKTKLCVSILLAAMIAPLAGRADLRGRHPAFLRALTDLRDARWNLEHRSGDSAARSNEDAATAEIDRAINDITRAAVDDGKNVHQHPRVDAHLDRASRLHNVLELLHRARTDVSGEETNPEVREVRRRAFEHIDAAIQSTERALHDLEHHH